MAYEDLTRPSWGGNGKDVDIHIEEHTGIVDSSFLAKSIMGKYLDVRTLKNSNALRIDRLSSVQIGGRGVGEALNFTSMKQEKFTLAVDRTLYARVAIDYFDDWTASIDIRREVASESGGQLAKQYDQAALITLQKAPDFVPPSSISDSFSAGILETATLTGTDGVPDLSPENAAQLVRAHRASIAQMVKRDLGDEIYSGQGVTFVTPDVFSLLLEHDKLMNLEFGAGEGGNSFAMGRVARLNGVRIVETPRLLASAFTGHPLGDAFNLSATEARRQMITCLPAKSLIVAQARPLTAKMWDDHDNFKNVIDTYQSYNVGLRRPDAVAAVELVVGS